MKFERSGIAESAGEEIGEAYGEHILGVSDGEQRVHRAAARARARVAAGELGESAVHVVVVRDAPVVHHRRHVRMQVLQKTPLPSCATIFSHHVQLFSHYKDMLQFQTINKHTACTCTVCVHVRIVHIPVRGMSINFWYNTSINDIIN